MSESSFQSLKGQLLLDGGELAGSFFHRAVVLICEHNAEGAFGLMLNRVMEDKVGELVVAELPERLREQPLFLGGPVQPAALSYLLTDTFIPDANILPNLSLGHSLESLVELGGSFSTTRLIKIFAGYAGWSPGQLEGEMKRNAWVTHPATPELVVADPLTLWRKILREKGGLHRLIPDAPDNLSWN